MAEQSDKLRKAFQKSNEYVTVTGNLSEDKLKLFIDCKPTEPKKENGDKKDAPPPPKKRKIVKDDILSILKEYIDPHRIKPELIESIVKSLNERKTVLSRRIAQGKAAVPGLDGKLELLVKKLVLPTSRGSRTAADTRFVRQLQNVEAGTVIANIHPPTEGSDGMDVLGKPVKAKAGQPVKVVNDKTILRNPPESGVNYETLVAEVAGFFTEEKNRLTMSDTLVINGDVDLTTGVVNFIGNVVVKGDIKKGYRVRANGSIDVEGNIHGASLISSGGPITVKGFAAGGRRYSIETPDTVTAHIVQDVMVSAGGDITITREARDSYLHTKSRVLMPQGHVFGGQILCGYGVEAGSIGSTGGTLTTIKLSQNIESEKQINSLTAALRTHDEVIEKARLALGPFAESPDRLLALDPEPRKKMDLLLRKLNETEGSKELLIKELEELQGATTKAVNFRVNVKNLIHTGVVIEADTKQYIVQNDMDGPKTIEYDFKTKKFVVGELKPLEEVPEAKSEKEATGNKEDTAAAAGSARPA